MKLRTLFLRRRLLLQIAAILMVVVFVPLLAFGWITTQKSYRDYSDSRAEAGAVLLNQYADNLSQELRRMNYAATAMASEHSLSWDVLSSESVNVFLGIETMETLNRGISSGRYGLYWSDHYIYTNKGRYGLDNYLSVLVNRTTQNTPAARTYTLQEAEAVAEILTFLNPNTKGVRFYSSQAREGVLAQVFLTAFQVRTRDSKRLATVFYEMDSGLLKGTLDEALGSLGYAVCSEDGTLLWTDHPALLQRLKQVHETEPKAEFTLEGEKYTLLSTEITPFGLRCYLLTREVVSETMLNKLFVLMQRSVLWMLVLYLMLAVACAYLSYRPILKVLRGLRSKGLLNEEGSLNDIQRINQSIDGLMHQNEAYQRKAVEQDRRMLRRLLKTLVEGEKLPPAQRDEAQALLSGPFYCAVVTEGDFPNADFWQEPEGKQGQHCCFMDTVQEDRLVILTSLESGEENVVRILLAQLREQLELPLDCNLFPGIVVNALEELHYSYLTAVSAQEQQSRELASAFRENVQGIAAINVCSAEQISALQQALRQGDEPGASRHLEEIMQQINREADSSIRREYAFFSLSNMLAGMVLRMNVELDVEDVGRLVHHDRTQNREMSLKVVVSHVCHRINQKKQQSLDSERTQMADLVSENIHNPDFCLTLLAEKMKLKPNHVSRLFHEVYNAGFTEYITVWRLDWAKKELVLFPQKAIYTIAEEAGFSDVAYFNRVFKNACGMTPGAYRKGAVEREAAKDARA